MRVRDIVRFNNERCFNGAVQTEWYYDPNRVTSVAESYVFHGPKYFGVSDKDQDLGGHRLIDTASFALNLADKLYSEKPSNSFLMTIAGYGAGKSHLAVSLAALFSGDENLKECVLANIRNADAAIAGKIEKINTKKNFLVVLNGMNNFNLDAEVLKCVKTTLKNNGISEDVLKDLTKSYDIARHFIEKTFDICKDQFEKEARKSGINHAGDRLKQYLLSEIEASGTALSVVNAVYKELNGDSIQWDRGLAAGDILSKLQSELCGEGKPFNKILVLFDEFGRFIEYAAANPAVAGEAALQQIFEAVQSASGKIIFTAFVQSELDAYLARIEKTSNIMRYVGRYKASENLFLSSNYETILANLLVKSDDYGKTVNGAVNKYDAFYRKMQAALNRWDRSALKKGVWTDYDMYSSVILKGTYPLHPFTVWLLSNMNNWMQQRSAIAFAAEMVDRIANKTVDSNWLSYVYPINIIDSGIYSEMLNSEEKGLVQSQYCMLYRDIMVKVGDKLSDDEKNVLKAVLVINIGRFAFLNRDDAIVAIKYCSGMEDKQIEPAIRNLENLHGVLAFDENANSFDLVAEANGLNEFKRVYSRYRLLTPAATIDDCDEMLRAELMLNSDVETAFSQVCNISSCEWRFKRSLMNAADITAPVLSAKVNSLKSDFSGESNRGELIYVYCNGNSDAEIDRLSYIYRELSLKKEAIILLFIDDTDGEIISALTTKKVLNRFSKGDYERFEKHIISQKKAQDKRIIREFNKLAQSRLMVGEFGAQQYQGRITALCTEKFNQIYSLAIPFVFDGFEVKTPAAARRYLSNICIKLFDRSMLSAMGYNALSTDEKNRVKATLAVGKPNSWQVFDGNCQLVKPGNERVKTIFDAIERKLSTEEAEPILKVFGDYCQAPYGMNMNSLALLAFYFIAYEGKQVIAYYGTEKLVPSHLSDKIFKTQKLQPKEFLKIRLQKNAYADVDRVRNLSEEILRCIDVEKCESYKKRLSDLLAVEGTSAENQLLVASAQARLDEGCDLYLETEDKLKKANVLLGDATASFGLQKIIKVFAYFADTSGTITANTPFIYSKSQVERMEKLKHDAEKLLKSRASSAIDHFTCKITQLSQYKMTCSNIAKTLRQYGYSDYADALDKKAASVEEELLAKQKYEAALVDFDKDVTMCTNIQTMGYAICMQHLDEMSHWEKFFEDAADLPSSIKKEKSDAVCTVNERLKKRLDEISKECAALKQEVLTATTARYLSAAESKMLRVVAAGVSQKDELMLADLQKQISAAKEILEQLPKNIDELRAYKIDVQGELSACRTAVNTTIDALINDMNADQAKWIAQYLDPVNNVLASMSASECARWLDRTSLIPDYLEKNVVVRYTVARTKVEAQLHSSRVEGVYQMYDKLSADEKAAFHAMVFGKTN